MSGRCCRRGSRTAHCSSAVMYLVCEVCDLLMRGVSSNPFIKHTNTMKPR
jgi:hypothetical protein